MTRNPKPVRVGCGVTVLAALTSLLPPTSAAPAQQAYVKASNTFTNAGFGYAVAISGDTMVVGAPAESSVATGVNGNQNDHRAANAGAVYVFVRDGTNWTQQAYLKASNTGAGDQFGYALAISGDVVVVGAPYEDSNATGVNGADNNNAGESGAAYVFVRSGTNWSQQAYLKASNAGAGDLFGWSVAASGDTVVVGAWGEDSSITPDDAYAQDSGAAYVFVRDGTNWTQQAMLKAPHLSISGVFGAAVAVSGDTVVITSYLEDSDAKGVNGNWNNSLASASGAAYVFVRHGTNWSHQAYLKASNADVNDAFGWSVALSGDTAVIGSYVEASNATGVNGDGTDNSAPESGAAYVFVRNGTNWSQQAYLKASNTRTRNYFARSLAMSGDAVVVGAPQESSSATGINGDQTNFGLSSYGAAYVFVRQGTNWSQQAYLKASNSGMGDFFGGSVGFSDNTVVVGAPSEDSRATGINGDQADNNVPASGAAYVISGLGPAGPHVTLASDRSGGWLLRFTGAPDVTYRLQRTLSMTGPWETIATLTAPASGLVEFHDQAPPAGQALYRTVRP